MNTLRIPSSVKDLAAMLALEENVLLDLSAAAPRLYRVSRLPKKRGGFRVIEAPHKQLKAVQQQLLVKLFDRLPSHPMLAGGKGSSTKSVAKVHVKQPLVLTLDIQDFFPSVTRQSILSTFERLAFPKAVSVLIGRLVTRRNRLPQGAPTSSAVARLVMIDICEELATLLSCIHPEARATVYVDDLTISGPTGLERLIPTITKMFRRYGFTIAESKTNAMPASVEQVTLGLAVNHRVQPSQEFEQKLRKKRSELASSDLSLRGLESYKRFVLRPS